MKKFFVLLGFILLCAAIYAGNSTVLPPQGNFSGTLEVNKIAPSSAALGDTITVTISVLNNGSSTASAYIEEGLGNVVPVSPLPTYANITGDYVGARSPYISWTLAIAPGETKSVSYQIKPKTVGPLTIGPTAVWVGNKVFYSNSLLIEVACSNSTACDESIGETALTCPAKCAAANATGNTTSNFQPVPIASAPIPVPKASTNLQEISAQEKKLADEGNNQLLMIIGAVVLVILVLAAVAYFFLLRKPGQKYGKRRD